MKFEIMGDFSETPDITFEKSVYSPIKCNGFLDNLVMPFSHILEFKL
jgi:hypothetical protein